MSMTVTNFGEYSVKNVKSDEETFQRWEKQMLEVRKDW